MTIKTNNHWRDFVYRWDVPAKVLESDFDYQDPEETVDGFFQYRGCWYHLDQFMRLEGNHPFDSRWQGYLNDSFFSGVLIEISEDGEQYRVATFY